MRELLARDWQRHLFPTWKPVLAYHLDRWPEDVSWVSLTVRASTPDRSRHRWQQDVGGFVQLVRRFTEPGMTVCDPFLGSGTTGLAALTNSRRFIGADIDARTVAFFRGRQKL
jgi:DNA modification methylase